MSTILKTNHSHKKKTIMAGYNRMSQRVPGRKISPVSLQLFSSLKIEEVLS